MVLLVMTSAVHAGELNPAGTYRVFRHGETMRCYWHEAEALTPHNAAARVLEHARELDLSHEQMSRIISLVEDYDRENRDRERELAVVRDEIYKLLSEENIDSAKAVERADRMTGLEFHLWQEFIDHLQQVKEILSNAQKRILRRLWEIRCRLH